MEARHIIVEVLEARNCDTVSPYVGFAISEKKYRTKSTKKSSNPKWQETFAFDVDASLQEIPFGLYDNKLKQFGISQLRAKVGKFVVPLAPLFANKDEVIEDWFRVERYGADKEKPHPPEIHLRIKLGTGSAKVVMNEMGLESPKTELDDTTVGAGAESSDEEPDMTPRSMERRSIKMDSTPSSPSPASADSTPAQSPITSPVTSPNRARPDKPLPTTPLSKSESNSSLASSTGMVRSASNTSIATSESSSSIVKSPSMTKIDEDADAEPAKPEVTADGGSSDNKADESKDDKKDEKDNTPSKPKDPLHRTDPDSSLSPKPLPAAPLRDSKDKQPADEPNKEKGDESLPSSSSSKGVKFAEDTVSPPPRTNKIKEPEQKTEAPKRRKKKDAPHNDRKSAFIQARVTKKKEPVKPKEPTKLVESFFVVGVSSNLDPIDDRYEYHPAASPVDMIYKGDLLDCFPKYNDTFPPHIWMFCLPRGIQLLRYDPGPSFFPFVLTSLDGTRLYGACLTFYEIIADSVLLDIWKKLGREEECKINGPIYAPKCIGTLSRFPFYSLFRDWLNEIFQKVFYAASPLPIERYIHTLISETPMPLPGGQPVQVIVGDKMISCRRPAEDSFPLAELPYQLLFKVLDIHNVLTVFSCILQEEKVVFTSSHFSVLTIICEIFSTLLYPFEWVHVYVPILPELLLDFAYSPTPFIMGVHKNYINPVKEELSGELVIVDLDNNKIHLTQTLAPLPEKEVNKLIWELQRVVNFEVVCNDYPGFNPSHTDLKKKFSHFVPPIGSAFDDYIRFAFCKFFASIFQDYRKNLMYLRVFPKPIAVFNKMDFMKSRPDAFDFMKKFMETQSFTSFLENHSWPTSQLFDDWLQTKKHELTLEEISQPKRNMLSRSYSSLAPAFVTATPPTEPTESTETLYEYHAFPSLNPELLGTTFTHQSQSQNGTDKPTPSNLFTPFKTPEEFKEKPPASPAAEKHSQTETEEAKVVRQVVQKFIDGLYENPAALEQSDIPSQVTESLKFDYGRAIFGQMLVNDSRATTGEHSGRISEPAFNILGEMLHAALRESHANMDLISPQTYLKAITTYHRIAHGAQEYLFTKVKNQEVWQNHMFWEKSFFDKVELECKKLYNQDIQGKMRQWTALTPDDQEKIIATEEDMVFNLVFSFAFNMVNLSLPVDTLRRFVTKICLGVCLNDEHTNIIMQLLANMARAKEIEDAALGARQDPGKQDTELKLHFTKQDNYLPIGMPALDESGNGRELFTTLVEEKSVSLVGSFRSLSRKLNLKSKWDEQAVGKYQEVSEERGGYVIKTFAGHKEAVLCLAPSAGGKEAARLVTGSCDGTLMVWDMLTCQRIGVLEGHSGWVNNCAVESDGIRVLSGSYDRSVKLWDMVKMQKIRTMRGHKGSISCLQAGAGKTCISASYDNTLMLWDYRHQKAVMTFVGHQGPVMSMLWDADENRLISGSRDSVVRMWDVRTGKCLHTMTGHTDWVKCLVVDGDLLLSGSCDGRVKIWSLDTGVCSGTLHGHTGSVNAIQLMNNDENASPKFITASADSLLKVWDSNYAACYQTLSGHTDEVIACCKFLSNCIASASFDGNIRIWDAEHGKSHRTIAAHTHRITSMQVHDSSILTASWDKTAKICEFGLDFRV